jgi:hypothetical protein
MSPREAILESEKKIAIKPLDFGARSFGSIEKSGGAVHATVLATDVTVDALALMQPTGGIPQKNGRSAKKVAGFFCNCLY